MRAWLGTIGRHRIASLISTVVDFGAMTLIVELGGGGAVVGTLCGATLGALTNFELGRRFTFKVEGARAPQAARYAIVSGASAGWNALGEYLLHDKAGLQYLVARAIVAVLVSLLWNFPMQRRFVFRAEAA